MEIYLLVKWLHIIGSTVLFGFGAGTAWYLGNAHLTGDATLIAKMGHGREGRWIGYSPAPAALCSPQAA